MGLPALAIRRISGPGLLSKHLKRIGRDLAKARVAGKCILLRVNESGCVRRTLKELRAEVAGEGRLP
jgi:hypothetical protein